MCTLYAQQVGALEGRARPGRDVLENLVDKLRRASRDRLSRAVRIRVAVVRRAGLPPRGQQPFELIDGVRCYVEHRFLDADTRRARGSTGLGLQSGDPMHDDAVGCVGTDGRDRWRRGSEPRVVVPAPAGAVVRAQRGLAEEHGRMGDQDRRPGTLSPRERAGVVHVDSRVDPRPLPTP